MKLSAEPEPHAEVSTFMDEEILGIQLISITNHRMSVALDTALSHEEVVSIDSGKFNDRDNKIDEDSHANRLCDICHPAQSPSATAEEIT
ncbi:unnamed protein product [Schistosoma mattheei]|uniref:Uncharacterized protein n=1 Tax=Schistosoma mattheei TaxID=31246 RepID=A0A3P8CRK6_9TREM|nr:unnamed protein product [Schistosoma mattheei]